MLDPVLAPGDAGAGAVVVQGLHVLGPVDGLQAGLRALRHQVARDLGLAVDHHLLAGQGLDVDAQPRGPVGHLEARVRQALLAQPGVDAGLGQQVHGGLRQHAGADAAEHVFGAALLDDDVGDTVPVQQGAEQQAGRAGADDGHLGAHGVGPFFEETGKAECCAAGPAPACTQGAKS